MKLPLKIKGLAGIFAKLKGAKAKGDGEDDDDAEGADDLDAAEGADEPADSGPDDDAEAEDGEGAEEGAEPGLGKRRLILVGGGGAVAALVLVGAGAWYFLGGEATPDPDEPPLVPTVGLQVPPTTAPPEKPPSAAKEPEGEGGEATPETAPETPPPLPQQAGGAGVVVASTDAAAFRHIPVLAPSDPLPKVPDHGLIEQGSYGPLPKVGKDGRKPWQVYARPSKAGDDRPRIAVIVTGLGLSQAATEAAIKRLPGAITLAFDPHATGLDDWVPMAREAGHEILLSLPMEPARFPFEDAGPYALKATLSAEDNLSRLEFLLSRLAGYVGVLSETESKLDNADDSLRPVLQALSARGLMFVGALTEEPVATSKVAREVNLPRVFNDLVLDKDPAKAAVDARLAELEVIVRKRAVAVATAAPYPSTIERLAAWAAGVGDRNLVLVPVSALADKQLLR